MALSTRAGAILALVCGGAAAAGLLARLGRPDPILDVRCDAVADGWDVSLTAWGDGPVEEVRAVVVGSSGHVDLASATMHLDAVRPGAPATWRIRAATGAAGTLRVTAERPTSRTWDTSLPPVPR